ncbi:MAG: hypothetical protein IJB15_14150 [Clostridia bacterium]|nr:hypothetical protein [Clostridia bacterium]
MFSREFDGDLLITDPVYVMREGEDWGRSAFGFRMEALGVRTYLTAETLVGDWDCGAYDAVSGKEIGRFCSDSGLVSVFRLEEILRYNPAYREHLVHPYTAVWIRDFRGTVQFTVRKTGETEWICITGQGENRTGGEEIRFITAPKGISQEGI